MKHLLEIAQLITRKKGRKVEIFDESSGALSSKNSKFNEFYEALLAGRYKNDRDAATHLYGCSPTDDRYRQLKSRFRKRLLNTLFFLDQHQTPGSSYDRAIYACNKDWALVRILLSNDAPHTAADLARSILNTALKFQFADHVLNAARVLRDYAVRYGTEQEFEEYDAMVREYVRTLDAEIRSETLCQYVALHHRNPPSAERKNAFRVEIEQFCQELGQLYALHKSPVVFFNALLMRACRCEFDRQWDELLVICREAEQFMTQHPHFQQSDKAEKIWLKKIGACLHLRDFAQGRLEAEKLLQTVTEGGETWFAALDWYFLLAMHTGEFAEASAIYERASQHSKFRKLPTAEREKWQLYETYLDLFLGEKDTNGRGPKISTRNGKPLHEPLAFAKDNRLFAVHHSVAQVVTALAQDNYIGAAGQIDWLKSLANRQFKTEEPDRTQQFIRLLQHLAKAGFATQDLNGAAQAYADLRQMPFHYRGVVQDLEIVPYERIWEQIMQNLQ